MNLRKKIEKKLKNKDNVVFIKIYKLIKINIIQ